MCSPALGAHFDACLSIGRDQMESSPYGQGGTKNQPHQIILGLELTALNFAGIITVDPFGIQSNNE